VLIDKFQPDVALEDWSAAHTRNPLLVLSFVSEFGSFTGSRGTNPTRRELAAKALLDWAGADSNASDRSDVCDWRESLRAEARREARHASVRDLQRQSTFPEEQT
jgi:hypothetical protein